MNQCEDVCVKPCQRQTTNESTIELEPFIHQVGGRSAILVFGDCICKPVNDRELIFYESIEKYAPQLKSFVPQFNGVISVNFTESNDGYLMITTKSSSLQDSHSGNNHVVNLEKNENASANASNVNNTNSILQSPNSPYQKFVTKYRVKLCRPLREIIIESHEEDIENDVSPDLECSKKQLEDFIMLKNMKTDTYQSYSTSTNNLASPLVNSQTSSLSLSRSRSTSISIPNFEDGNFFNNTDLTTLFDNQLFVNEAGQNGLNLGNHTQQNSQQSFSRQTSVQSSPTKKLVSKSTTKHNPWVLKTFSALSEFTDSMKDQRFIMLENLVSKFEYPCIMDLKMGTRLHDDNATESKKQSHESKVNETTSGALGLRITGIQIYDKSLDRFICYNKYYGRKLSPESFKASLKKFVSNENFVAHNLLEKLITKLKQLRSVVVELKTFRFYTSSLLLIYEGNTYKSNEIDTNLKSVDNDLGKLAQDSDKLIDVRIIDFAHSTHGHMGTCLDSPTSSQSTNSTNDYDEGFVFGLDNLIKILTLFQKESNQE